MNSTYEMKEKITFIADVYVYKSDDYIIYQCLSRDASYKSILYFDKNKRY